MLTGTLVLFQASNITQLKKKTQKWARETRESGMKIGWGWDRDRVKETESGYKITVYALSANSHTQEKPAGQGK